MGKNKTDRNELKKNNDYSKLKTLFFICLRLGAFTFGGGYAMFPLMEKEYVDNRKWFNDDEMIDILAISQSLPGMISINACILIGYRVCGALGSIIAVLGLSLPSLVVMSIVSYFYVQFSSNEYVLAALKGIRVAVIALLVQAVIKLGKPGVKGAFGWIMAIAAFLLSILSSVHLIFIILSSAVIGIIYTYIKEKNDLNTVEEGNK